MPRGDRRMCQNHEACSEQIRQPLFTATYDRNMSTAFEVPRLQEALLAFCL